MNRTWRALLRILAYGHRFRSDPSWELMMLYWDNVPRFLQWQSYAYAWDAPAVWIEDENYYRHDDFTTDWAYVAEDLEGHAALNRYAAIWRRRHITSRREILRIARCRFRGHPYDKQHEIDYDDGDSYSICKNCGEKM